MAQNLTIIDFNTRRHLINQKSDYEFFSESEEPLLLFQYTKKMVDYIICEGIENLILLDRSARPFYIAIREYFKINKPDKKAPNIYFVNPKGFIEENLNNLSFSNLHKLAYASNITASGIYIPNNRNPKAIASEFASTYKRLVNEKDKPLLVFDTCIHTGKTMAKVKDILDLVGFEDVQISSVNPADSTSIIKTDFYLTNEETIRGCFPFGQPNLVKKSSQSVLSNRSDDDDDFYNSSIIRAEIKKIINYYSFKKDKNKSSSL
jgi:hypothetical protein